MAKADDLRLLVDRLMSLKASAVAAMDEWGKLLPEGITEAKVGGLRVWFYDSTLPETMTFPAKPEPTLGIDVREGSRMEVVFRIHIGQTQLASEFKAAKWKRGLWEQALAHMVPA